MSQDQKTSAIDVSQFNLVFFEECAEHLAEMEQILISLADAAPDSEQLNAIFRAAHSIKGGAGIFGFQDMTVVTHVLESLLDRLRNFEMPFTPAMIDLFLEAGDVIAMQLSGHRHGSEVSLEAVEQIRTRLQQVIDGGGTAALAPPVSPVAASAPATAPAVAADDEPGAAGNCCLYELLFTPEPDIFKRGVRLENLFAELEELGELTVTARPQTDPPPEAADDPEICSTFWEFTLLTGAGEAEIREVFEFVAEEEQLLVNAVACWAEGGEAPPADEQGAAVVGTVPPSVEIAAAATTVFGKRAYDKQEMAPGAFGRRANDGDTSIRVGVAKVDQLINQVGELVITQLMVSQTASTLDPVLYENLHRSLLQLERTTRDLQQSVMSIRLMPISLVFNRFPRMVRELAGKLGKQVELKTVGEGTELDKGLIEKMTDPLSHLVRNAMDHALETPEVRVACGKDPVGSLTLRASQVGGRVVIDVIDDGAGLNRGRILDKARERGIAASEEMSDDEVWQLIFAPGFSTAEAVTDISGRGVGMDVVMKNVQSIGGRVAIASEAGKGTRVTISLPLTLAIMDGLSVGIGDQKFIIPLNAIVESLQPLTENLNTVNGRQVVQMRGEYIPIVALHELFNIPTKVKEPHRGILILVEVEGEKAAILVDSLLDELQVVIKSIEDNYRKVEGTAGATILGDGRVAMILDVNSLLEMRKRILKPVSEQMS